MSEIFEGSLESQSLELILAAHDSDTLYKTRLANLKVALTKIDNSFRNRVETISKNADKYQQSKVADMLHNLRLATRREIEELVKAKGFAAEIDECVEELKKQEPLNDVQTLTQTMLEIEVRQAMTTYRDSFQALFEPEIIDGNPLFIGAIENSPVSFPIREGVLADGRERMLNVLKPLLYKKYQAMLQAQNSLEAMAGMLMPINKDIIPDLVKGDQIKALAEGAE